MNIPSFYTLQRKICRNETEIDKLFNSLGINIEDLKKSEYFRSRQMSDYERSKEKKKLSHKAYVERNKEKVRERQRLWRERKKAEKMAQANV